MMIAIRASCLSLICLLTVSCQGPNHQTAELDIHETILLEGFARDGFTWEEGQTFIITPSLDKTTNPLLLAELENAIRSGLSKRGLIEKTMSGSPKWLITYEYQAPESVTSSYSSEQPTYARIPSTTTVTRGTTTLPSGYTIPTFSTSTTPGDTVRTGSQNVTKTLQMSLGIVYISAKSIPEAVRILELAQENSEPAKLPDPAWTVEARIIRKYPIDPRIAYPILLEKCIERAGENFPKTRIPYSPIKN